MRLIVLSLPIVGCTIELAVGVPCEPVVISEVMAANRNFKEIDGAGTSDWFQLANTSTEVEADLGGYVLLGNAVQYAYCVVPKDTVLAPGASMLVVASTYELPGVDAELVCFFDFNNDSDRVQLRSRADEDYQLCDSVAIPDQHYDFSWQRDPADPEHWCVASAPTPYGVNEPCLCDVADDC